MLLSSIWAKLIAAGTKVVTWVTPVVKSVVPSIVTDFFDNMFGKKDEVSDYISEQAPMVRGQETVEAVQSTNKLLFDMLDSLKDNIQAMENEIVDNMAYTFEEFVMYIDDASDVQSKKFARDLERIKKRINGQLNSYIHKEISLDNPECRKVLEMRAGDNKKLEMDIFIEKSFDKALEHIVEIIKDEMLDFVENIQDEINYSLDAVTTNITEMISVCEKLTDEHNTNAQNSVIVSAMTKIALADMVINTGGELNGVF
ncbi:MAG: hypothetical protein ATN35_02655 [Epulopiscium sp. Nele67-Bin004]|nr:MAG: hypothetical protein ATN35_02655 [Epulopiscium sp. Nele67-Bin004]